MRLFRSALWLAALMTLANPVTAQDRNITILPNTDLPGFDYNVLKDVDRDACQASCAGDNMCQAFTFNERAGWCFMKSEVGKQASFKGATSGIVDQSSGGELAATRTAELPYPGQGDVDSATSFASNLRDTNPAPKNSTYEELVETADQAVRDDNADAALIAYKQALGLNGRDAATWLKLADTALAKAEYEAANNGSKYDPAYLATLASLNAFLRSEAVADQASALSALAHSLSLRESWRESIATYRASLELVDDRDLQATLDQLIAEHGFRITSNSVDADGMAPRICIDFSDPLPTGGTDLSGYVVVDGAPQAAVETQQSQICITGIDHGRRYTVTLRAGLPSNDGETLRNDVEINAYVPDRAPFVGFANNAYVLPAGLGGGLPITSVNAESADVVIYRIGDRNMTTAIRNGVFGGTLTGYSAEDVAGQYGEKTWEGTVDLAKGEPNANVVTAIPVTEALGTLQPGAYVVTAKVTNQPVEDEYWSDMATQWFVVTDLGLTTVAGDDGVHAFVRALGSAQPVANAKVRLVAVNNEILGEATTDAEGKAVFAPGLARGEGGRAPQLLVAETTEGDYNFLDISRTAFDLTDRGVEGRPYPGPLDLFATTERGVYRPGETVFVTALLRDPRADAVADLPLTMEVERPDGVVSTKELLNDKGAGGYYAELPMVVEAMRGSWTIRFYADPKSAALTSINFLVEDFEPERLAFEIKAPEGAMSATEPTLIDVAAKYLYGAVAPGLNIEADAVLRPTFTLKDHPGYRFGRQDDSMETSFEPLGVVATTGDDGTAEAEVTLPYAGSSTRPLEAQVVLRLVDSNGRTVQRSLSRPVLSETDRIGVKPAYDENAGLDENSKAQFDVIAVAPTGELVDKQGLKWTLSRIETTYQWYKSNGAWKWESITTNREVGSGTIDATASGPVTVGADVTYGRYLFSIESEGDGATSSSYEIYAGYYYAEAGSNTPDTLDVALDKTGYKVGETASLRLDPQFAGTALVMVVDNRVIDMVAVDVPAEGTTVELPVTEEWGPGAYVTAMLYRPSDDAAKRMPARALGLAFADVEPGDRQLDVKLDAPTETLPRQTFTTTVKLGNAAAGEKAYVAVAAVDLGILNLTNFKVPDPDGWFFGQRQLGMEIRDLYGLLIDPTQGMAGALRSGGDGGASRLGTPPATTVLVAQHSGIVEVDADGNATVTFDMPDFNGTVRVMAMAWSAKAVGHASADVIVRDPVVVNLSPPRFMRLDDSSRILFEIDNINGPEGDYTIALDTAGAFTTNSAETEIDLKKGDRATLDLDLTATAIGDHELAITITDPEGKQTVKMQKLGVRAAAGPQTTSSLLAIGPGESVTIGPDYFDAMVPHTGSLTLAIGPIARLNVPELLLALDRYPYGCAEQISSRAMPLLYLNSVADTIGLGRDDDIDQRIRDAITNLLSKQTSSGAFGLWGPFSSTDLWLDAYVTDFLLRAKDSGYDVPETALNMALDNLGNQVSYASDFSNGGEDVAYALYDLAKSGRAAIGDLRYYLEARLDNFGSPLAKAQLGAALALYGDRTRSAEAFAAAVDDLQPTEEQRYRYRNDYGSQLRDTAGVLALVAEFKPSGVDASELASLLSDRRDVTKYASTQEDAWTLLAAASLMGSSDGSVKVDGMDLTGDVIQKFDQEHFDGNSVVITNTGNRPTEAKVSVTAIPSTPPEARNEGFSIESTYYLPDGSPADFDNVRQNDRFVVVLTLRADQLGSGQYVVADPLPGGFEIENANLSSGAGTMDLSWLTVDTPSHVESRTDQYVAAFRFSSEQSSFTTAYMVRATNPGTFVLPAATIEDMYRPELRANTGSASVTVQAAGQ